MFFRFPPDAGGILSAPPSKFGIGVGDYEGIVRVSRCVFQSLLDKSPTPQRCLEAYHPSPDPGELIAERKLGRRQLTDDGQCRDYRPRSEGTESPGALSTPHRQSPGRFMRAAHQAVRDTEQRFPVRIRVAVPPRGLGSRLEKISAWLDASCGADASPSRFWPV